MTLNMIGCSVKCEIGAHSLPSKKSVSCYSCKSGTNSILKYLYLNTMLRLCYGNATATVMCSPLNSSNSHNGGFV